MQSLLSQASGGIYKQAIKPLLFRANPDSVHERLLAMSRWRQKLGFSDTIVQALWAYRNPSLLGQTIHGITFSNPVGLSAGFDKNIELVPTMKAVGFGFMTGGSTTYYPCSGNPRPWFYRLPHQKSLVVHVGLANQGTKPIRSRIRSYKASVFDGFPLIVSIAKTNNPKSCDDAAAIDDYVGSLKLLRNEPRVSAIEINISCPNTYGGEPFTDPTRLGALLDACDAVVTSKPILIKMPVNHSWKQSRALLDVIVRHRVQGVTIGNLSKDRQAIPLSDLPATTKGNLSGVPTQKLSDDLIGQTYQHYGDKLTIIGVGGIFNAEDAYRKICLGASLVQLITGMIFEGPQLIGQINHDLARLLQKDGYHNTAEAIGSAHRR